MEFGRFHVLLDTGWCGVLTVRGPMGPAGPCRAGANSAGASRRGNRLARPRVSGGQGAPAPSAGQVGAGNLPGGAGDSRQRWNRFRRPEPRSTRIGPRRESPRLARRGSLSRRRGPSVEYPDDGAAPRRRDGEVRPRHVRPIVHDGRPNRVRWRPVDFRDREFPRGAGGSVPSESKGRRRGRGRPGGGVAKLPPAVPGFQVEGGAESPSARLGNGSSEAWRALGPPGGALGAGRRFGGSGVLSKMKATPVAVFFRAADFERILPFSSTLSARNAIKTVTFV